jgi:hypothetical protein
MCYSPESSIAAFSVGMVGAALCISLGTVDGQIIGAFFAFVALMQGVEYLLWNHQKCDMYNRIVSILGMILNHAQPVILGLLVLWLKPEIQFRTSIIGILVFYIACIVPYSAQYLYDPGLQCTMKNELNHLYWNWNKMPGRMFIYNIVFLLSLASIFYLGFRNGALFAIIAFVTYFTSVFLFYRQKAIGALWCFYVVGLPVLYYIYARWGDPRFLMHTLGTSVGG